MKLPPHLHFWLIGLALVGFSIGRGLSLLAIPLVLSATVGFLCLRALKTPSKQPSEDERVIALLRERYMRDEISLEDYEHAVALQLKLSLKGVSPARWDRALRDFYTTPVRSQRSLPITEGELIRRPDGTYDWIEPGEKA